MEGTNAKMASSHGNRYRHIPLTNDNYHDSLLYNRSYCGCSGWIISKRTGSSGFLSKRIRKSVWHLWVLALHNRKLFRIILDDIWEITDLSCRMAGLDFTD